MVISSLIIDSIYTFDYTAIEGQKYQFFEDAWQV